MLVFVKSFIYLLSILMLCRELCGIRSWDTRSFPIPEVYPISYLLLADDCFLFGRAMIHYVQGYHQIIKGYCLASGQWVNLQKSTIHFSPKILVWACHLIRHILGILEPERSLYYLGVFITGRRLLRVDCDWLILAVQESGGLVGKSLLSWARSHWFDPSYPPYLFICYPM